MFTRSFFFSLLLLLGAALQYGCTGPECPGKQGCTCDTNTPCNSGLTCQSGTCAAAGETTQESGPAEVAPEDAGPTERCEPGTAGCRCMAQESCQTGLRCEKSVCVACTEGSAGCPCKSGGACDNGLTCENNLCSRCEGKAYCACYKNNSCDVGQRCESNTNGNNTCKPCSAQGEQGCNCEKDGDCSSALLCVNKRCQPESALAQIPKEPKCYTPCTGNIRDRDGTIRICHPNLGLMEGCQVGQTCQNGSCVGGEKKGEDLKASAYPYCMSDENCPSWQRCIQGRCYSNCKVNSECPNGMGCYAYVCRQKCDLRKTECSPDETCQNVGSTQEEGFCLPSPAPQTSSDTLTNTVKEVFLVSSKELSFTNRENTSEIALTNQSEYPLQVKITRESDTTGESKPLSWLTVDVCQTYTDTARSQCQTYANKPTAQEPFSVEVPAKGRVILKILGAEQVPQQKLIYSGVLRIQSGETKQRLDVRYRRSTNGRWQGKIYSFGNFDDTQISQFPASDSLDIRSLKNAFLRRWINFKRRELTFDQWKAILESLRTESWQLTRSLNDCKRLYSTQASEDVACYPSASSKGYDILSYSQREAPVPSGVTSLDLALDVKEAGSGWEGRIVSSETLHYPGDPQIKIGFSEAPGTSTMSALTSLSAVVDLGGRYHVDSSAACDNATDFQKSTYPWFIPGFTEGTSARTGSLFRERSECRSQTTPKKIPSGASAEQKALIFSYNQSLSAANPIHNGRTLRRTLELVDGVLYENQVFFAIVRERFTSPFASSNNADLAKDWVRYGYMLLRYVESDFKEEQAQGNAPSSCTDNGGCASNETCEQGLCQGPSQLKQVVCSPEIVKSAVNRSLTKLSDLQSWSADELTSLVDTLMGEQSTSVTNNTNLQIKRSENNGKVEYTYGRDGKARYIHYLCEDTRQFDGGPIDNPQDCPSGSRVIYFENTTPDEILRANSCQSGAPSSHQCDTTLQQLRASSDFREDVPFRCEDTNAVICNNNRKDMREGKIFFKPSNQNNFVSSLAPIREALLQAFRYRIKFQTRSGQSLAFAPEICNKNFGSQIPYCYDPVVIEEIEQRVNCLEAIFTDSTISQKLGADSRTKIKSFLEHAFSYSNRLENGQIVTDQGFETLNAELKVMMGDEAFTRSLKSRYELANSTLISFEGDSLEPNGVRLSGVLGYEMYNLYLSVHYYQSVLDRFYSQTDTFVQSFRQTQTAFLTAASINSYVRKLLLAASRKARSWGAIAKKYHQINRSDLAQQVLERAYISSYIEQIVLTQLLNNLMTTLDSKQLPQLQKDIQLITNTYNAALIDMQESYQKVLRKLDYFGFPEGYVPFPALARSATAATPLNAFNTSLQTAKEKMYIARDKEQIALQDNRKFETDAASFQSELVKLEQSYDEQLIQICGELKDGSRSVPAIPRYAHLYRNGEISDPCGMVPGGALYQAYATLERVAQDLPQLEQQRNSLYERIDNEKLRIQKFCSDRFSLADITWTYQNKQKDLQLSRDTNDLIWQGAMRAMAGLAQVTASAQCVYIGGTAVNTECQLSKVSTAAKLAILIAQEATTITLGIQVNDARKEMAALQRDFSKVNVQVSCNVCPTDNPSCNDVGVAVISSQNYIAQLALELEAFRLHILTAQYNASLLVSQLIGLQQKAQRLMREQSDSINKLLDVQSAQNDPNVRIYKNDAVLNAERAFEEALQEAYSLTLIYEYYTNSTYLKKDDLYLVRMISSGDKNLESYLSQLEQAYRDFEEQYGRPSLRVMVLSLRDDILKIPSLDAEGNPTSLQDRIQAFQKELNDPKNYTPEGYLQFTFPISVDLKTSSVSPITYGHKLVYVEAEIKATEKGDDVGRVYLRQNGTSVIREASDNFKYYALPSRTAVINTFFNGHKIFDASVYQNYRLQDRPLGNNQWQLLFNQNSEKSNQDIVLNSINDIVLYLYYQDFSKL